jgi:pyruvate formate lyase activating enzyme
MYRYSVPPTPKATIDRAVSTARRQLNYVYPGNVTGERSITVCQECGATLLSRLGYATDTRGLRGSRCAVCGSQSPIINSL